MISLVTKFIFAIFFVFNQISVLQFIKLFPEHKLFICCFSCLIFIYPYLHNFSYFCFKNSSFTYFTFSRHRWIKVQSQLTAKNSTNSPKANETVRENQLFPRHGLITIMTAYILCLVITTWKLNPNQLRIAKSTATVGTSKNTVTRNFESEYQTKQSTQTETGPT